jgi:hypothetical protein
MKHLKHSIYLSSTNYCTMKNSFDNCPNFCTFEKCWLFIYKTGNRSCAAALKANHEPKPHVAALQHCAQDIFCKNLAYLQFYVPLS